MTRRWVLVVIAANLLALVALVFAYPQLMVSPGPVVQAHAEIATDCFACHAPLRGAAPQRCVTCHVLADIGVRTTKGAPVVGKKLKASFHQQLIDPDCMACHSDHEGPKLTRRSRMPFSHALLVPASRERCEACHKPPTDSLHAQIEGNCAQCHKVQGWKPATFEHDKLFLLDRDHNTTCVTCHVNNDYSQYTCYGCHEHQPDRIRSKHEREGIQNFENCVECHRSANEEPRQEGSRKGRKRD